MLLTETETKKPTAGHIQVFEYLGSAEEEEASLWDGLSAPEEEAEPVIETVVEPVQPELMHRALEQQLRAEFDKRLSDETKRAFEQGRERGKLEGQQAEREAQSVNISAADERRNRQIAAIMERFTTERDHFLHQVEHEVVQLALAVAARILRREAQMDPLLLTGAVRVALGQLAGSTKVRLKVPNCDLEMWRHAIALIPRLAVKPELVAGEDLRTGDCLVETELGTVDLGIRSQLGEIEHGFFDRAAGLRNADTISGEEPIRSVETAP